MTLPRDARAQETRLHFAPDVSRPCTDFDPYC